MPDHLIADIDLTLKSPGMFTKRVGIGNKYDLLHGIPGSTILGALSQEAIIRNVESGFGNCESIKSPRDDLDCEACGEKAECVYYRIWINREVKIRDALPLPLSSTDDSPFIPHLQTIHQAKQGQMLADSLLLSSAQRISAETGKPIDLILYPSWIELPKNQDEQEGSATKKKPKSVFVGKSVVKKWSPDTVSRTHVGMNRRYLSSEKSLLYEYQAYPIGSRFRTRIIGERRLLESLLQESSLRLGAGRSRGYGRTHMTIKKERPVSEIIEKREEEILRGFERINLVMQHWGLDDSLGTVTGLTPLPLTRGKSALNVYDAIAERAGIEREQLVSVNYRREVRPRFERNKLILTPSISAGYAASFSYEGAFEELARNLAEIEIGGIPDTSGMGWVEFNHEVHTASWVTIEQLEVRENVSSEK